MNTLNIYTVKDYNGFYHIGYYTDTILQIFMLVNAIQVSLILILYYGV